jgi:hypothetical protein
MFKTIFYIALIGFIIYAGILFGAPYYKYRVFKSDMHEMSKIHSVFKMTESEFKKDIVEKAEETGLPITEKNIKIYQNEEQRKRRDIVVSWAETVDLFGLYQYTYNFSIDTR